MQIKSFQLDSSTHCDALHFRFLTSVHETLPTLSARYDPNVLINGPWPCLKPVQRLVCIIACTCISKTTAVVSEFRIHACPGIKHKIWRIINDVCGAPRPSA